MKTALFLMLVASVALGACSSSDDTSSTNTKPADGVDSGAADASAQANNDAGTSPDGTTKATLVLGDPSADYNGPTGEVKAEPVEVLSALTKPPSIQIQVSFGKEGGVAGDEWATVLCQLYQSSEPKAGDACDVVISYERIGTGRWAVGDKGKGKGKIDYVDSRTIRVTYSVVLDSLPPKAMGTVTASGEMTVPVKNP